MLILNRLFGDVREHKNKLASILRTSKENIIILEQVHGDKIYYPDKPVDKEISGYDAMITDKKGMYLLIKTADCQSVAIKDPVKEVVANIHNGWKGSAVNIVGKVIKKMIKKYGCDAKDLVVNVSASLGPCCGEFSDPYNELPEHLHKYILENNHVDFWKATKGQCTKEGVLEENIHIDGNCTVCNNEKYYSYRGDEGETGRNAVIVWI
jgi:purine-nucleoside/S-methyl-5'-thioadenosine phosphorylase / adenosine deaminase